MKTIICTLLLIISCKVFPQSRETPNIFIITTDGFRWQEIFNGADPEIINNIQYVKDTGIMKQLYWHASLDERRKKLMPFFWNVIARQGQLYGNRAFNNKVDVRNVYKISYPGYNELLTGFADPAPVLNTPTYNRNVTVLEYLNEQEAYRDKVVAFSSWSIFPFLFNKKRNSMLLNSGYQRMTSIVTDSAKTINEAQENVSDKTNTRYDLLTYMTAREYIRNHHPKVVYISFGETDEFAHKGQYDMYLQKANDVDKMISELWYFVQTDPFYKNKTTFLITTDHGRGSKPAKWHSHNTFIKGSGEIWLALLGNQIEPVGEVKAEQKIFQNQVAATISSLLGENFVANQKIGKPIQLLVSPFVAMKETILQPGSNIPERQILQKEKTSFR